MQSNIEEFARLTALMTHEEYREALTHSHLCRCNKCYKINCYLLLKEHIVNWEEYRRGNRGRVLREYDKFWETVAQARVEAERELIKQME